MKYICLDSAGRGIYTRCIHSGRRLGGFEGERRISIKIRYFIDRRRQHIPALKVIDGPSVKYEFPRAMGKNVRIQPVTGPLVTCDVHISRISFIMSGHVDIQCLPAAFQQRAA